MYWIKYSIISIGVDHFIRMIVLWWFNDAVYLQGNTYMFYWYQRVRTDREATRLGSNVGFRDDKDTADRQKF